jgi:type I restriction-modification system DNA methylase subunit
VRILLYASSRKKCDEARLSNEQNQSNALETSNHVQSSIVVDRERASAYKAYYDTLSRLREEFHSTGRFDDANSKLDEIVKLLIMRINEARRAATGKTDRFTVEYLKEFAEVHFGDARHLAQALRALSEEILGEPAYLNPDGTSVFGSHAALNIQPVDDAFAERIVQEVRSLSPQPAFAEGDMVHHFDVLNESFGHFIRDTFRNTKDDAQYMTPHEVVTAMVEMVFSDIERDKDALAKILQTNHHNAFVILDPAAGVGSFLVQALRRTFQLAKSKGFSGKSLNSVAERLRDGSMFGQDKIDRMVRLAKVNMMLFGGGGVSIWQGNSIRGPSAIDVLQGKVDLILTNPPFGAEFDCDELLRISSPEKYPMVGQLRVKGVIPRTVHSEVLFLDRCLSLLAPGGRLAIVLPDNVISAKGGDAAVRDWVRANAELKAVVELPSVTFAQAGTRTKTCFVYLQKHRDPATVDSQNRTFMAVCEDIGFNVVERVGVPVKLPAGENQLSAIWKLYEDTANQATRKEPPFLVVCEEPSVVWVRKDAFINGRWTPRFYHVRRLAALSWLERLRRIGFDLLPLSSVAELCSKERRKQPLGQGAKMISVLHVSRDGVIDLEEVLQYNPKTEGLRCEPGEVLFSKINPRIPRICVVPKTAFPLACSTEFEILRPKCHMDPYLLVALLFSPAAQEQVRYLTSGTSSSHNRIKDSELAEIVLPLPGKSSLTKAFSRTARSLRLATDKRYKADAKLALSLKKFDAIIGEWRHLTERGN